MTIWRILSIAIGAAFALSVASISPARADDAKAPAAASQPAAEAGGAMMKDMPGCPGSPDGSCCGSCQEAKKELGAEAAAGGGCPCQQRARLAAQKQAAEQAQQAQ